MTRIGVLVCAVLALGSALLTFPDTWRWLSDQHDGLTALGPADRVQAPGFNNRLPVGGFDFFRSPPSGFKRVQIHTEIISRDTGKPMALYFSNDFPVGRPDAACIRELLIEAVRHEIEECIFVDGVRVWDPHVNGRNEI